jgi:hypothetical protein
MLRTQAKWKPDETILPNETIMLAIFEKFLANPQEIRKPLGENQLKQYVPATSSIDTNTIRWHLLVFFDEFVLDRQTIHSFGNTWPKNSEDYLNWEGKHLYYELKQRVKQKPDEK